MSRDIEIRCSCDAVHGVLRNASQKTVNRITCYCDDCQAFLHQLGRADLLDERAGTEIVQVAPSSVSFDRGEEQIAALRLTDTGLFRWHARCCNMPIGNTTTPAIPFIGIPVAAFRADAREREEIFGKSRGGVFGKFALGGSAPDSSAVPVGMMANFVRLALGWKLRSRGWPHPFFHHGTATPSRPVSVLSASEREALRALCGPSPAAPR